MGHSILGGMMKRALLLALLLFATVASATVTTQTYSVSYTCIGSTGPFAFAFPISDPTALTVIQNGVVLAPALYTTTPVNNDYNNGGSVTLLSACTSGYVQVLSRVTPITQTIKFYDNMPIPMKTFERALDKLTEIDQEIWGRTVHSIQMQNNGTNVGSPLTGSGTFNYIGCAVTGGPNYTIYCPGTGTPVAIGTFNVLNNTVYAINYTDLPTAIAACPSTACTVVLSCAGGGARQEYPVSSTITIDNSYVTIRGEGQCADIQVNHTGDVFTGHGAKLTFKDFSVTVNTTSSRNGSAIFHPLGCTVPGTCTNNARDILISNVLPHGNASNPDNGMYYHGDQWGVDEVTLEHVKNAEGGNWQSVATQTQTDTTLGSIEGLYMNDIAFAACWTGAAIDIDGYADTTIGHAVRVEPPSTCTASGQQLRVRNTPGTGQAPTQVWFTDSAFTDACDWHTHPTCQNNPLVYVEAATDLRLSGGQISGPGIGVQIGTASLQNVRSWRIEGVDFHECGNQCIIDYAYTDSPSNVLGNAFTDSCFMVDASTTPTCHAIELLGNAANVSIDANGFNCFSHCGNTTPFNLIYAPSSGGHNRLIGATNQYPTTSYYSGGAAVAYTPNTGDGSTQPMYPGLAINNIANATGSGTAQLGDNTITIGFAKTTLNGIAWRWQEQTASSVSNTAVYINTLSGSQTYLLQGCVRNTTDCIRIGPNGAGGAGLLDTSGAAKIDAGSLSTAGLSTSIPVSTTCTIVVQYGIITGHSGTGCP